ncbi:MAG: hypothetical protein WEB90_04575 [Gemmatimonadota bacterium]
MNLRRDRTIWVIALAAALLHMVPYWHAQAVTEPGWTFTGTIHTSPDFVQYRSWPRQAVVEGPIVTDRFTSEENDPHLPVFFYWGIGLLSEATGVSPEWIFAYAGAGLAASFVFVLVATVRTFVPERRRAWWIVGAALLGGGLGAHAKVAKAAVGAAGGTEFVADAEARVSGGAVTWMWFEDYRGHYIFNTLFDTHFLLIWLAATLSVLAYWNTLTRPGTRSLVLASLSFALATILHVYEGVTLLAIVGAVSVLWWVKRLPMRVPILSAAALTGTVGICLAFILLLQRSSGLPMPDWSAFTIPVTILFLAYPLAWGLIVWGGIDFWRAGGERETFLLGWILGCTALTLSGPFYPYPDRGTMTLQIAVTLVAGMIWFARYTRVSPMAAVAAVLIMGVTPAAELVKVWRMGDFSMDEPHKFLSEADRRIVEALEARAASSDLLVVEEPDVLWLGPRHPGRFYCGHFFLTVDFEGKCMEVNEALGGDWASMESFLRRTSARFIFTGRADALLTLRDRPELEVVAVSDRGSLFEYRAAAP